MSGINEWLRERSLWQVLGVYIAGSWVAFEVVATLTEALGLPGWLPRGALILIAAGLPILAAAVHLRRREGLFTVKNALVMGVAAFAALLIAGGLFSVLTGDGSAGPAEPSDTGGVATATYVDPADDPRPSVAVLSFADMSPDSDQEYFSDGISEEILGALSRIRSLRLASRSSALTYKGRDVDPRQVGAALGVAYLVSGSVRKDGDDLRISAELVDSTDGTRVWSESYDRRLESIFVIQSEIAEAVAEALRAPLGLSSTELVDATMDMDAHDLYLNGRAAMRRRGLGVGQAIELFEAASRADSTWAPAWAALAEAHAMNPLYVEGGAESRDSAFWANSLDSAVRAARRALALDPRNASARIALGSVHRDRWEWAEAERELLEALRLDPDNGEAHLQYSEVLWGMGRLDEALRESGRALALDRSPIRLDAHGFVLYMNGRFDEAEALLEEGIAIDPDGDVHFLRLVLGNQLLLQGRYREALDRFAPFLADSIGYRWMGEALERGDASQLTDDLGRGLAQTLVILGEHERALDVLQDMVFAMPFRVQYDIWDPHLEPIWDSDRFQNIILPRLRLAGMRVRTTG